MILRDFKFEPLNSSTQIIVFDNSGAILESDDTLVKVDRGSMNVFSDTMFCGMEEMLKSLNEGEELTFDCIDTDLFGRTSQYDFIIKPFVKEKEFLFGLIIYDFSKQYSKIFELQQERNMAEIRANKVAREKESLAKEKDVIERLYNELQEGASEYVLIKSDNLLFNLDLNDILYIEAYGDYIKIHTDAKVYVTHSTLKNLENILPKKQFFRIHRSFVVRLNRIENIEQMSLLIADKVLPIGKMYKAPLLESMRQI